MALLSVFCQLLWLAASKTLGSDIYEGGDDFYLLEGKALGQSLLCFHK